MESLPAAFDAARDLAAVARLEPMLAAIDGRSALYVGSGGAAAVAELAAELHLHRTGALALATSPLALVAPSLPRDTAAVIISSRAAHPDVGLALEAARRRELRPIVLITHRSQSDVPGLAKMADLYIEAAPTGAREGFLATRSVLSLATGLAAVSGAKLPRRLPGMGQRFAALSMAPRVLILHGPRGAPAARDLETRLSELGLAAVQMADYRNFAHGRHYGFLQHLDSTRVIAMSDLDDVRIANRTLSLLPSGTCVLRMATRLTWPASTLDLLVRSMRFVGALASTAQVDASHPKVPEFGRRLYHLSSRRQMDFVVAGPVERKLLAVGRPADTRLASRYQTALQRWLKAVADEPIGGVVLDYDGTVCDTSLRYDLPEGSVQQRLLGMLEHGLLLGFASGRGDSLIQDLRAWIPDRLWEQVEVGPYNGARVGRLSGDAAIVADMHHDIRELRARLASHPLGRDLRPAARPMQLSFRAEVIPPSSLAAVLEDVVHRSPALPLRVVESGHSVDVILASRSKRRVVDAVASRTSRSVLAIGDQGQRGGNDFDLLAATPWSLSVDRCSSDPTRCWNLLPARTAGSTGLLAYLDAISLTRSGAHFRWKHA